MATAVAVRAIAAVALLLTSLPGVVAGADIQGRSFLLGRAAALANLRARQQAGVGPTLQLLQRNAAVGDPDAVTRTLQSLDVNHNGKIDSSEIAAFAQSQGLDSASATSELSTLDVDGDGSLSAQELAGLLDTGAGAGHEDKREAKDEALVKQLPQSQVSSEPAFVPAQHQVAAQGMTQMAVASVNDGSAADVGAGAAANVGSDAGALATAESREGSGRSNAQSAANTIVKELALESREEAQAQVLEHRAAELRANSTALSRRMIQNAMAAGSKAAAQKAKEVLATLLHLETEETRKEVAAAALRAKAKAELREAQELMSIADTALKQAIPSALPIV